LKQSAEGEAVSLDEDLKRLKEKLPERILDKFQCETKGYYTIQFHSYHTTSISLFQMDPEGKCYSKYNNIVYTNPNINFDLHLHSQKMEPTSFHLEI
jgi:hypothetical protein